MVLSLKKGLKKENGIAIVEAMVALSILTIGMLGVMGLVSRSLSINRVVADQYAASFLAAEGVEVVKNLIDANKIQGWAWLTNISNGDKAIDFRVELGTSCGIPPYGSQCPHVPGRTLVFDPATGEYTYDRGAPGPNSSRFERIVTINRIAPNEVQVLSKVTWTTRGNAQFSLNVYDHFFDWRP